ncbi:MAG: AAA family ATPase [Oscillibacter sp.]|nr:AAA family ATPase [Oscillibacter sp.]
MFQNIPEELKETAKYCVWKYEPRPEPSKPAKVPYNPKTGQRASVSAPQTFGTFNEAVQALQSLPDGYEGIGILIAGPIHAIDIDNCLDDHGQLSPMAADIVQMMDGSYTEVSPSGHGIRIIFTTTPDFKFDKANYYINNQSIGLEIYTPDATSKYVTITGNVLTPGVGVQERTQQVTQVLDKYMRRTIVAADPATGAAIQPQPPANRPALSDDQVIQAIRNSRDGPKFDKLFAGDMSDYDNNHSKADMGFCVILALYTKDPVQIDRIFRASALMRSKWDRSLGNTTYGRDAIDKAIPFSLQLAIQRDMRARASTVQQSTLQPDVVIAATDLMNMNLADLTYFVDGLIPEGTGLLAAPQKAGKSWFALDLARSLADGTKFLGRDTTSCGVLYLALEDSNRRLKSRLGRLLQGEPVPQNLYFATAAPTLADGLLAMLSEQLEKHPDIRFIIIDTLQIVRSVDTSGNYSYSSDYYDVRAIKNFGEENHVSFLLLHHTRKNADTGDIFNTISGTMALSGAADYSFVLQKKRAEKNATLHATGRDIADMELIIAMDEVAMRWNTLGDAVIIREERERKEFLDDPVVQTVYELVEKSTDHTWSGQAADIVAAARTQNRLIGNETAVGCALPKLSEKFQKYLGIAHKAYKVNGNAGSRHDFTLCEITTTNCEAPAVADPDCEPAQQ